MDQIRNSIPSTKKPDNYEVSALELTPPPNGAKEFNEIGEETFDDAKEVVLVGKTYLESMLN